MLALVAIYIIPGAIVIFGFIPSWEYQIKNSQGRYPGERGLGDAVWTYNDSEIDIELITIDGRIFGEINTEEVSFTIQGKFLYNDMYLYCNHQDNPVEAVWESSQHTIVEANYEYVDGKIECSNLKTDLSHFDFSKDFALTKEKNIDKNLFEEWKCEEMKFQIITYTEIDEYILVKFPEKNKKFQLVKLQDNYYELIFSPAVYSAYGFLERQDEKMVFNIVRTYINKGIVDDMVDEQYIPDDVKTLNFVKKETGDGSTS